MLKDWCQKGGVVLYEVVSTQTVNYYERQSVTDWSRVIYFSCFVYTTNMAWYTVCKECFWGVHFHVLCWPGGCNIPSKYSPWKRTQRWHLLIHSLKQSAHSCLVTSVSCCSRASCRQSKVRKLCPLRTLSNLGKRKKSAGDKSGEYGGCAMVSHCLSLRKSLTNLLWCARALSMWMRYSCLFLQTLSPLLILIDCLTHSRRALKSVLFTVRPWKNSQWTSPRWSKKEMNMILKTDSSLHTIWGRFMPLLNHSLLWMLEYGS